MRNLTAQVSGGNLFVTDGGPFQDCFIAGRGRPHNRPAEDLRFECFVFLSFFFLLRARSSSPAKMVGNLISRDRKLVGLGSGCACLGEELFPSPTPFITYHLRPSPRKHKHPPVPESERERAKLT